MKRAGSVTSYEDFKYVMQDTGNLYLGAKYTYEELLSAEMAPFKLKAVINHYVLKETAPETTLESQFYYLEKDSFLFEVFSQLKTKVKVQTRTECRNIWGKTKYSYKERIFSLTELTGMDPAKKRASGMMIREIIISKLGMMTFSV